MQLTENQVKKVLSVNVQTSQLGMNLLLTRMKGLYSKQPTAATLARCTGEINGFLQKFSGVMQKDFEMLAKV